MNKKKTICSPFGEKKGDGGAMPGPEEEEDALLPLGAQPPPCPLPGLCLQQGTVRVPRSAISYLKQVTYLFSPKPV